MSGGRLRVWSGALLNLRRQELDRRAGKAVGEVGAGSMRGDEPLRLHLGQVLDEVQLRINAICGTQDRVLTLLEAVLAVGRGQELPQVLQQVVGAAVALMDAAGTGRSA
ncbi:hypothetical protein [Streptomyces roseochromogenus]|uniref:hypothetical protein n=1 Tax=Streptomyces roseochromogenus TaxID=285450 RepID=UPI000AC74608|nr:hypothetical protein [Streptomyces roseochromogenus]